MKQVAVLYSMKPQSTSQTFTKPRTGSLKLLHHEHLDPADCLTDIFTREFQAEMFMCTTSSGSVVKGKGGLLPG